MKLDLVYEKEKLVRVTKESGIPLVGALPFGIIDRGTNLLQVRCTSICNMNCSFCSTDGGPYSRYHKTNYIVDINYLVEEVEKIVCLKRDNVIIFLDSVGEPMSHPDFVGLVEKLKRIKEVSEIVTVTNGTFLTKDRIDLLKKAGLTRINLSFHSMDKDAAKKLFGMPGYDVEKIIALIFYIKDAGLDLMLTPVWIPNVNDTDIEEIIKFAKKNDIKIGLQKYETYKNSRKTRRAKKQTYWKFFHKVKEWEKTYNINLLVSAQDLNIQRMTRIPEVFRIGDRVNVEVLCSGWMPGQMMGKAKDRCITINNCNKKPGEVLKARILQNKNSIYLSE